MGSAVATPAKRCAGYFETDAAHVVVAALDGLRQAGEGKAEEVEDAIRRYGIDPDQP